MVAEGGGSRGRRQWWWNFNDIDYGRWKHGMSGDGVRSFSEGKRGRRRGGSTVSEADDISKSDAALVGFNMLF
jgi:hypothetical protein